jgi:hypothetical protein
MESHTQVAVAVVFMLVTLVLLVLGVVVLELFLARVIMALQTEVAVVVALVPRVQRGVTAAQV